MTNHFSRILALMPVVALAAACNGPAPTSSTDVSTGATATDSGEAAGMTVRPCSNVTGVSLRTEDSSRSMIWVVASYQMSTPGTQNCPAPKWTADRKGLVVDRMNPFRAGYPRTTEGVANVTASAPNGVQNSIRLELGGPTTSLVTDGDAANVACKLVNAVNVTVVPGTSNVVSLAARYGYSSPTKSECTIAPTWSATRSGLSVGPDGFHASIARTPTTRPTTVTATAPNRVSGRVTF